MDPVRRIALYARVSSQRQADEATIQSQVATMEQRVATDGGRVESEMRFLDEGYSGGTLQRPALERLRDLIHAGGVDRLYVHNPDRLARKYVHQALLLEEFARQRVDVVFLTSPRGNASPEGELLLQMQGMIAEYERAKILERTRRGRRFNARQGRVSVLSSAPYGYRYVRKREGDGEARYEVVEDEARRVREMFRWVAIEGLTLAAVSRRLSEQKIATRTGRRRWDQATIRGLLLNPAYYGQAEWGKTRMEPRTGPVRRRRGQPETPRQPHVARPTQPQERERIAVPALIGKDLFDAVGERLAENRRHQRERQSGAKYLLSGLLVCGRCGSAYCGRPSVVGAKRHVYYRCLGTDKYRNGGEAFCQNAAVAGALEEEVWSDACELIRDPERLRTELERRQEPSPPGEDLESLRRSVSGLKRQLARLLDLYEGGYLEKEEFTTRAERVRERLKREEESYTRRREAEQRASDQASLLSEFASFVEGLKADLESMDLASKRKILRLLIKRIEVKENDVQIVYKVQLHPPSATSPGDDLQHRLKSVIEAQGREAL
jgi:site-specific DNA recombinase